MRLFVSYARVDMPLCKQIAERLEDVHEVWYDKRLFAGQNWWNEIKNRLDWCDGFVFLLSPEAIASEYCQEELRIAQQSNKHIFPVLIQARTPIPSNLSHIHYADLSQGMENIYVLLNAITVAERSEPQSTPPQKSYPKSDYKVSSVSEEISEARGGGRVEFRKVIVTDRGLRATHSTAEQFFISAGYKPKTQGSLSFERGSAVSAWTGSTDPKKVLKAQAHVEVSMSSDGRTQAIVYIGVDTILGQVWMNVDSEFFKAEIGDLESTIRSGHIQLTNSSRMSRKAQQLGCLIGLLFVVLPFILLVLVGLLFENAGLAIFAFLSGWPLSYFIAKVL
jgi:hypothetical protein